jgi:hypothetical protein
VKSISRPETDEMKVIDAAFDFSSQGIAAFTTRTECIMSVSKPACQAASSSVTASAETLATTMSIPPSVAALSFTQAASAFLSATSTARPITVVPCAFSASMASVTPFWSRAQIATFAPSAAKMSAQCRPIPLLPPVTRTFSPFSPRSMSRVPFLSVSPGRSSASSAFVEYR